MIKAVETNQEIFDLEQLRIKVLNMKSYKPEETYYYNELKKKKALGIAYYEDNKVVAGCILTGYENNLFIDWIFTDENYRNQGKASELINYIEQNKKIIGMYFNIEITFIKVDAKDELIKYYKKRGFREPSRSHYMTKVG